MNVPLTFRNTQPSTCMPLYRYLSASNRGIVYQCRTDAPYRWSHPGKKGLLAAMQPCAMVQPVHTAVSGVLEEQDLKPNTALFARCNCFIKESTQLAILHSFHTVGTHTLTTYVHSKHSAHTLNRCSPGAHRQSITAVLRKSPRTIRAIEEQARRRP